MVKASSRFTPAVGLALLMGLFSSAALAGVNPQDDPSYHVEYVKNNPDGGHVALVMNDNGMGVKVYGSDKKSTRKAAEAKADDLNAGATGGCVDICVFEPESCP